MKHYFNKQDNRNALLILDDIFDEKIINTFDFEYKTLVRTADIDVFRGRMLKVIKIISSENIYYVCNIYLSNYIL